MTETPFEKQSARKIDLPRLATMMLRPSEAFSPMASDRQGSWLTPMLILSISSILVVIVVGYLKTQASLNGVVEFPPDWEFWSPEMQESYLQAQQTSQGPLVNYVLPAIGALISLWLGWVIFAGIMRLVSTLLGGRGSTQSALNIVAWANAPFIVRDLLQAFFMLIAGHEIASPGLSGFVQQGFMYHFLSRTDIFLFWNIALLGIGFAVVDGLPKGKALMGVIVVVLILIAIQSGVGAAIASFG